MKSYLKVGGFGFLTWLIPFVVSVLISPLRESQRPLFESIMPVVVTVCVVFFSSLYLTRVERGFQREGLTLGLAWFTINIVVDLLLFSEGPMKMTFADYMMDIGLTYLIIPSVTFGYGFLLQRKAV